MTEECKGCSSKYAFASDEFQSTGTNSSKNASEGSIVFLSCSAPHNDVVLGVDASGEVRDNRRNLCWKNFACGVYAERYRGLKRYCPNGVLKVRRSALSSSTLTCQYPDEAFNFEK